MGTCCKSALIHNMKLLSKFVSITLFIIVFVNLTNSVFISRKKASKTIRSIARYGRTKNFEIEYNNPYPEQTFLQKIKKSTEEILDTDKIIEECFFKKCDFEEVLELSESFEVASSRWIDYTDRCRLDKYKCDPLNTIVCLNFWQGRKCVCKTGFTGGNCGKCIVK